METIEIRDALPDEYAEVAAVTVAGYAEYFPPDPSDIWLDYRNDLAAVERRTKESEQIVALIDGVIVGVVAFYPFGTTEGAQGRPPEWAGIRYLAVHPSARGKGIARALTAECVHRARQRGSKVVGLMTGNFMKAARGLYDSMGFHRVPELDEDVGEGIVGMQYRLDL